VNLFELLLFLHLLAVATWFGSGLAIVVMGVRALKTGVGPFSTFAVNANAWTGRAHPAAGVVLLLTGMGMVAEADIPISEPWIIIALAGLVVAMGIGGGLVGRTANDVSESIAAHGGALPDSERPTADRLLLYSRLELAVLVLVIADMVAKPGL